MNSQYLQNLKLTIYTEKRMNEQKDMQLNNLEYKFNKAKDVLKEKVQSLVQLKQEIAYLKQFKGDCLNDNITSYSKHSLEENSTILNTENENFKNKNIYQFLDFSNEKNQNIYFTPNKQQNVQSTNQYKSEQRNQTNNNIEIQNDCDKVLKYDYQKNNIKNQEQFFEDIFIIGITKNDFTVYKKTEQPLQPRFLYQNSQNIQQQNDGRIGYLLGDKIQPFIIDMENNQKSIQTLLLDQKNFFNQYQFYCINLNSEKLIEKNCIKSKLLHETNVCDSEYYYCLKTFDYFVEQNQKNTISFYFFEKVYVIKTLFPVVNVHYDVLKKIFNLQKQKNLLNIKNCKIMDYLKSTDYQQNLQTQIDIIKTFVYEETQLCDHQIDNDNIVISLDKQIQKYILPDIKYRSFACNEIFNSILQKISFESFLFIWLNLLNENSIVFIGQNKFDTTGAIQIFTSILYPFKWTYPILSNLTEQCFSFLSSPVPLIAGINKPPQFVLQNLIPQHAQKLGSNNIYYFMDFDVVYCKSDDLESLTIPSYHNQIKDLKKIYRKINEKKNQYIKISKQDQARTFQRKNFQAYKNQMIALGQKEYSIQNDFITNVPINKNYDNIFLFIKRFYGQFILSTLPLTKKQTQQLEKGESENVAQQYYPENEQDKKFYQKILSSQGFSYYLSHNQICK